MRNYISILAVALVALFATSCQLESGTDPNPNKANNLLWSRTYAVFDEQYQHVMAVMQLNDTLRDADYGSKPYEGYKPDITESEGVYTLTYGNERTYKINTAGKKLEEGGAWSVQVKYGTYMEFYKLGTVCGVVGEPTKFSVDFDDMYGYRTPYHNALKSDIEYVYNSTEENLDITFSDAMGYSVDSGATTMPDYIIEFKSVEPMNFYGGVLYSGKVDILYKDNVLHTERGLAVTIFNKFVTFASPDRG